MAKKSRAGGVWTESRYWSFIRSNLRRAWIKYPVRGQVLNSAKKENDGRFDRRTKFMYQCSNCLEWCKGKDVQVDHIEPCGSLKGPKDLEGFITRLFCEPDNACVLCKPCHKEKTNQERNLKKGGK